MFVFVALRIGMVVMGAAVPAESAELTELFENGVLEGGGKIKAAAAQAIAAGFTDLAAALEKAEGIAIISDGVVCEADEMTQPARRPTTTRKNSIFKNPPARKAKK